MSLVGKVVLAVVVAGIITAAFYSAHLDKAARIDEQIDKAAVVALEKRVAALDEEVVGLQNGLTGVVVGTEMRFESVKNVFKAMVGAVLEQKAINDAQQAKIEALEARKECKCEPSKHKTGSSTPSCVRELGP